MNNFLLMLCTLIGAIILSINIQEGLNLHLYEGIEDALSSLRWSTSSFDCYLYLFFIVLFFNLIKSLLFYGDVKNAIC